MVPLACLHLYSDYRGNTRPPLALVSPPSLLWRAIAKKNFRFYILEDGKRFSVHASLSIVLYPKVYLKNLRYLSSPSAVSTIVSQLFT